MSRQGRHGESYFAALCQEKSAAIDAVVNKASDDLHGWDYIIDLAPAKDPRLPADLQPHLYQSLAQIKTTCGKSSRTKLKLSNAIKAAKSSLPSFVFLFHHVTPSANPILYGRHIWISEIADFLKRARETEVNGKRQLYKQIVTFNFSEADLITINPADWIMDKIEEHGGQRYSDLKSKVISSVGYDHCTQEAKVSIGPLDTENDIVLHEIGLIDDLPLEEFILHDVRFGIKSKYPINEVKNGRISFTSEAKPLTLQLHSQNGASFDIPALGWVPSTVNFDHPDFRTRVKAGHIDILASFGSLEQKINIKYNSTESFPFLEQLGLLCLLVWSQEGSVLFKVQAETGEIFNGKIVENLCLEPWMPQLEAVGHHMVELLGRKKCEEISLSYTEFSELNRAMNVIVSIFNSRSFRLSGEFESTIEPFDKLIGYYYAEIGDWAVGVVCEFELDLRDVSDFQHTFYFINPKIISKISYKQPLSKLKEKIKGEFDSYRKGQVAPVATLEGGDLVAWIQAMTDKGFITLSVD